MPLIGAALRIGAVCGKGRDVRPGLRFWESARFMRARNPFAMLVLFGAVALAGFPAAAQSVQLLGDHNAWSAYTTTQASGKICFAMSRPTATDPLPDGYQDAYFYISHRVGEGVRAEINLVSGYPFAADAPASLSVGEQRFALYTAGDSAWLADESQSAAVNQAIRAGATMVIEGQSESGVRVRQTFSLTGATAATRAIDAEC